jgi:hypothetical protein
MLDYKVQRTMKKVILMLACCLTQPLLAQNDWQPLPIDETLSDWTQLGGEAKFFVEDGVIVGELYNLT